MFFYGSDSCAKSFRILSNLHLRQKKTESIFIESGYLFVVLT